ERAEDCAGAGDDATESVFERADADDLSAVEVDRTGVGKAGAGIGELELPAGHEVDGAVVRHIAWDAQGEIARSLIDDRIVGHAAVGDRAIAPDGAVIEQRPAADASSGQRDRAAF